MWVLTQPVSFEEEFQTLLQIGEEFNSSAKQRWNSKILLQIVDGSLSENHLGATLLKVSNFHLKFEQSS